MRMDDALRQSEERYRQLLGLLPVAVYTCDAPSGVITYYNDHAAVLWGQAPARGDTDLRFCGSFRLWRPDGTPLPHDQTPMAVAVGHGRGCRNQDVVIERPDGSRVHVLVNIDPVRDAGGTLIGAINAFHDVTAWKQAERALRDADRRKDEFLATLAHELRNPLAPIANSVQVMRLAGDNGEVVEQARQTIERQLRQLIRLVDDLLDVARITRNRIELRRERVALSSVIQSAVETSQPLFDAAGHELIVSMPSDVVWLHADLTRLAQAIANLLNNAARYTPDRGRIWLTAAREDGQAVIRVRDAGVGIPPENLPRIFDMFTPTASRHDSRSGLGIGLTLVQAFVALHDGTVQAASAGAGQGSEFTVRLPVAADLAVREARPEAIAAPRQPTRRVLVVDDNRDSAESLAMLLEFLGHDVRLAIDGDGALAQAQAFRPEIALLDIGMPGMNGYEVAQRIREQPELQQIVLIALTGWGQDEDRRRSQAAGFNHHLTKPADFDALERLLADMHPAAAPRTAR
jgi:PAS domain S-box-containing protein